MDTAELIESFSDFKEFKNIDRVTMMNILEDVFRSVIIKRYGDDSNYDVIINPDKGDLEMWRNRAIVHDGEVEDDNREVAVSDAVKVEPDFEIGEELSEEVKIAHFGRRNILSIKQFLASKINDLEKDSIYKKYN